MTQAGSPSPFKRIADAFRLNIQAIRVFNEQIGPLADEHDQTARRQWNETMQQIIPQLSDAEGPDIRLVVSEDGETPEHDTESGEETKRVFIDKETLYQIADARDRLNRLAPAQGPLLRRGALTTLVSYFEALMSDLVQLYYALYPARLSEKKTLSLGDLRTVDPTGVSDIERYLAANEADDANLDYFTGCLSLPLNFLAPERPLLTEVTQRRNLIVHNQGIVNRQYLSKVSNDLIAEYGAREGETLPVTGRYVDAAVDTVHVVGASLIQLCWRKWDEDSQKQADYEFVHWLLYNSLRAERFELTARVAERLKHVECATKKWGDMAIVNRAIALNRLGRTDEMEQVLALRDWSASSKELPARLARIEERKRGALRTPAESRSRRRHN